MIDAMYLKWRFGVKIHSYSITRDDSHIVSLALTDTQLGKVLSQKDRIQTYIARASNFMAYEMNVPLAFQKGGKIDYRGNLFTLSGSENFIELMLYQLFGIMNHKAEEIFCIPLQNRINSSGDEQAIIFLKSFNPQDKALSSLNMPSDSLEIMKEQLNPSDYKKRLLISLGVAYYTLIGYCKGFDEKRMTGEVMEYDTEAEDVDEFDMSDENKKKILYKTYMETCQKFMADATIYMDELGWDYNPVST